MEARIEGWNIVIIGSWNLSIFNPAWVSENLFGGAEVQVDFPLTPGLLSPRYTHGGVVVLIDGNRLLVHPKRPEEEDLQAAEDTALLILDLLPHTPLAAVGMNYRYVESAPSAELLGMLQFSDDEKIVRDGYEIVTAEIGRQLRREGGVLNLKVSRVQQTAVFNFNYNSQVGSAGQAREAIRGRMVDLQRQSLVFLQSIYAQQPLEVGG